MYGTNEMGCLSFILKGLGAVCGGSIVVTVKRAILPASFV